MMQLLVIIYFGLFTFHFILQSFYLKLTYNRFIGGDVLQVLEGWTFLPKIEASKKIIFTQQIKKHGHKEIQSRHAH